MPQWFRFYSEMTTDRKIDRICRATGQPKMAIIGAWSILLSIANDSPIRGALLLTEDCPFTSEDLAAELGIDEPSMEGIIEQLGAFRMLHRDNGVFYITNWDKRQYTSDVSTERVRRYRERQQEETKQPCNGDETLHGRDGNAPEAETEAETEPDTEAAAAADQTAAAVQAGEGFGFGHKKAVDLVDRYGPECVSWNIEQVRNQLESGKSEIVNPTGLVISRLKGGIRPPARASPKTRRERFIGDYEGMIES